MEIKKEPDDKSKIIMVNYSNNREHKLEVVTVDGGGEEDYDMSINPKKDVMLLAGAISSLILIADLNGISGAKLLRSVVTQLEDTFVDPTVRVEELP